MKITNGRLILATLGITAAAVLTLYLLTERYLFEPAAGARQGGSIAANLCVPDVAMRKRAVRACDQNQKDCAAQLGDRLHALGKLRAEDKVGTVERIDAQGARWLLTTAADTSRKQGPRLFEYDACHDRITPKSY